MNCTDAVQDLHQLLEEHLPIESSPALQQHLIYCDSCAILAQDFHKLFHHIDQVAFPELAHSFAEPIFQKIQRIEDARLFRVRLALAASVLMTLACLFFLWISKTQHPIPQNRIARNHTTPIRSEASDLRLKDQEWVQMSQEWSTWIEQVQNRPSQGFMPLFKDRKPLAFPFGFHPSSLSSFSFSFLTFSLPKPPSEPALKQVGDDFNQLIQDVKDDLGFLSFGL